MLWMLPHQAYYAHMSKGESTSVKVDKDWPTSIASSEHGANLNVVAFNMTLIAQQDPALAVRIVELYEAAGRLSPVYPRHAVPSGVAEQPASPL